MFAIYIGKILNEQQKKVYPVIEDKDFRDYTIEETTYISSLPVKEVKILVLNKLDSKKGVCYGPNGKETYYNLPMTGVVNRMRARGYAECDYPYIEREDGVKCLGSYVIVAASLEKHRRGERIETSLGQGIVCDTGTFADTDPDQIDIAVTW